MKKTPYPIRSMHPNALVLDEYEREIESAFERAVVRSYSKAKRILLMREARKAAHNTIAKNKSITFRVNAWDIERLKARALQEGMPYQTLLSSIVHKYVSGTLNNTR